MNTDSIWIYRIIPIQNLDIILRNGLYSKRADRRDAGFVSIGSKEVIDQRETKKVKCYPDTVVNDYVPFYFSFRTPMLYNIITGHGVPQTPQQDIIYLCCKLSELATDDFQWCFTDGNAATAITRFFSTLENIRDLDWRSINSTDFRDANADGDEDRRRKKHAEFLVKNHVPVACIKCIKVLTPTIKTRVELIIKSHNLTIEVHVDPSFYF